MPHLQYICIDIFWRCLQITGTTFDRTVVWFQWTSNGDGRKGEREQEERKRKEKALADTFWPFPNESTEKFFGNNKSNNWIMIQKIDWTRGFCKAEINCISFCYLLLRTNSHFKLNICHICILYVNFLFFRLCFLWEKCTKQQHCHLQHQYLFVFRSLLHHVICS